jgi:predicted ATPase
VLSDADVPDAGRPLPASTVTVLISDFEDSARLWAAWVDAMAQSAWLHREAIAAAVTRHHGEPIEEAASGLVGGAFARPSDAVAAALEVRRLVRGQTWPHQVGRHVRVAVHTHPVRRLRLGAPGGGFDVIRNRCLALCAVARRGQTLLSRMTRDLVIGALPADSDLIDLGVHRLPDMASPEHVYQLVSQGVPEEIGGLQSLEALPNNLPLGLSSFVGRDPELRQVLELLEDSRLLTLTGSGGVGKTRLALQAAAGALGRFSGGVWWVELAHVTAPALVGHALARALGVRPLPGQSDLEAATRRLAHSDALVIFDNCEHVLEAVGDAAQALLRECPEVKLLATSRAPLKAHTETTWRVPSMTLPELYEDPVAALARADAARLFVARALQVNADLELTESGAGALADICSELDGIPLALELAAARVSALSIEQIATGLANRFHLLTDAARGPLSRHATLRASVDWSHDLLSDEERTLFRRLAVFTGGFTLEAADAVAADPDAHTGVVDVLVGLVEKSLVIADEQPAAVRYRLLETVHEYALERLEDSGEVGSTRRRHRDFFLAVAEAAAPELATARARDWLAVLDADGANIASALDCAIATDPTRALQLCAALATWWRLRGRFKEADDAFASALEAYDGEDKSLRAHVMAARAYLLTFAGRVADAFRTAQDALDLAVDAGDGSAQARALVAQGALHLRSDPLRARGLYERARSLARDAGDEWCLAASTYGEAYSYQMTDDGDSARQLLEEALAIAERIDDQEYITWTLFGMGRLYTYSDPATFYDFADRAVAAAQTVGLPGPECSVQAVTARMEVWQGHPERALERALAARRRVIVTGAGHVLPETQVAVAVAKAALGDLGAARQGLEGVIPLGADDDWVLAWALAELATVLRLAGETAAAEVHARRAIEIGLRMGSRLRQTWGAEILGRIEAARGAWDDAERLLMGALEVYAERHLPVRAVEVLDGLAEAAAGTGDHERATRLLALAGRIRSDLGLVRWPPDQADIDGLVEDLRAQLGHRVFEATWDAGAGLTLERVRQVVSGPAA